MVPGVPGYHAPGYTSITAPMPAVSPGTPRARGVRERSPGLRAALFSRVGGMNNIASAMLFVHVRSICPGHPDHRQVIRSKCWIASRSILTLAGQGQDAWPGHPKLTRPGLSEVYPSLPGSGTRLFLIFRIPHQTNWRVFWPF